MYPFFKTFSIVGLIAGAIAATVFDSLVAGVSIATVFISTGLVWRANDPPVLPFALAFQWLFVVAGYWYVLCGGELKEELPYNVQSAIFSACFGILMLAMGLRLGVGMLKNQLKARLARAKEEEPSLSIHSIFWFTIITYSFSWIVVISPMLILFNAAQIIYALLAFREVLLCLLWFTILDQRRGYGYGFVAFLVAFIPRLVSKQSTFKELVFIALVVALTYLRPWIVTKTQNAMNRMVLLGVGLTACLLLIAGIVWEGAVKPAWRHLEVTGTPLEILTRFGEVTRESTANLDPDQGFAALVSRISSISQFARVLDRVPSVVAHEEGALTARAVKHIMVPRFLNPDKPSLGLDSWLATTYAGMTIGEGTSVGIGYMAEFYVDYGLMGMYVSVLLLGIFLGLAYALIFLFSRNLYFAKAIVLGPFIANFINFEATLPKLLGGFIMSTVVLLFVAHLVSLAWKATSSQPSESAKRTLANRSTSKKADIRALSKSEEPLE